jgi:hypothetical protein
MYKTVATDMVLNSSIKVNYSKKYDYVDLYVINSGSVDYFQISDHVYVALDENNDQIIGAKIMGFLSKFSLDELRKSDYPNLNKVIIRIYHDFVNKLY